MQSVIIQQKALNPAMPPVVGDYHHWCGNVGSEDAGDGCSPPHLPMYEWTTASALSKHLVHRKVIKNAIHYYYKG